MKPVFRQISSVLVGQFEKIGAFPVYAICLIEIVHDKWYIKGLGTQKMA